MFHTSPTLHENVCHPTPFTSERNCPGFFAGLNPHPTKKDTWSHGNVYTIKSYNVFKQHEGSVFKTVPGPIMIYFDEL